MGFPTTKKHRPSRRKLGRGQYPPVAPLVAVVTAATTTVTITFSVPVVVNGQIPLAVAGGPNFVSQTVVSPYVVHQTWDATCAAKNWTLTGGGSQVMSHQGGTLAAASGTFSA